MNGKKIHANTAQCLVAYFSRPGNNYVGGTIVNLPVGNTEVVATTIREMTGGDLFRIEAVNPYPEDYMETTEVAQQELRASARPKLTGRLETVDSYDVIFLGYPNWWGGRCRCRSSPFWRSTTSPERRSPRSAPTREAARGGALRISEGRARVRPS